MKSTLLANLNVIVMSITHYSRYTGTAVAMEKEPGILKEEHRAVVENLRDQIEEDLKKYKSSQ